MCRLRAFLPTVDLDIKNVYTGSDWLRQRHVAVLYLYWEDAHVPVGEYVVDVEQLEGSPGGLKHEDEEEGDDREPQIIPPIVVRHPLIREQLYVADPAPTFCLLRSASDFTESCINFLKT